jgi:hypothetical protein
MPLDDSHQRTSDDRHKEFSSLTMLLTLLTAINNGGYPVFRLDTPLYRGALEVSQSPSDVVLNAVAAILVRNHEIIAAIAQHQTLVGAPHDDDPTRDINQEDVDFAMEEGTGHQDLEYPNFLRFIVIPNNRDDDPIRDDTRYTLVNDPVQSHWSKCRGGWESLDIR